MDLDSLFGVASGIAALSGVAVMVHSAYDKFLRDTDEDPCETNARYKTGDRELNSQNYR